MEKSFLWLGCNKKHIKLKSNSSRLVKFKLGFFSPGTFEIGRLTVETQLTTNLYEACNLNSAGHIPISLDEYLNENSSNSAPVINDNISIGSLNNPSIGAGSAVVSQSDSAVVSMFVKNQVSGKYELFKRVQPFTVTISDKD